jgi:hypothetical protein
MERTCKSTSSQVKVNVPTQAKPQIYYAKGSERNSKVAANGAQKPAHSVLTDAVSCSLLNTNILESVESHTNKPLLTTIENPAVISTENGCGYEINRT